MRMLLLAATCAAALVSLPASAQALKPGLWEIQNKVNNAAMGDAMAQMQQQLESMPPEQRKQMEAMMGQRGARMAPGGGGAMAIQMCMTREMVEHNEVPMQEGCRITQQQRSGNTMKMAFTCTKPPSSGEGQFTFTSSEAYTSRMTVNMQENGRTETTKMETSGRWLQADCGNVKPVGPGRK